MQSPGGLEVYQQDHGPQVVGSPNAAKMGEGQYGPYYSHVNSEYGQHQPQPKEPTILGMRRATFVLSCILAFVVAAVVLIGGLLGSKIASLESSRASAIATAQPAGSGAGTPTTGAPATATTDLALNGWKYLGCYRDNDKRTLADASTHVDEMTNQFCAAYCSQKGYKYFGTEAGDQCYCGNGPVADSLAGGPWSCTAQCKGTKGAESCGGSWYLSLWTAA